MTPKEKAEKLVDNHRLILINSETDCSEELLCTLIAKQCALIAVNEIIKFEKSIVKQLEKITINLSGQFELKKLYWQEVKKEIENL